MRSARQSRRQARPSFWPEMKLCQSATVKASMRCITSRIKGCLSAGMLRLGLESAAARRCRQKDIPSSNLRTDGESWPLCDPPATIDGSGPAYPQRVECAAVRDRSSSFRGTTEWMRRLPSSHSGFAAMVASGRCRPISSPDETIEGQALLL
jgi:hypothetical protein